MFMISSCSPFLIIISIISTCDDHHRIKRVEGTLGIIAFSFRLAPTHGNAVGWATDAFLHQISHIPDPVWVLMVFEGKTTTNFELKNEWRSHHWWWWIGLHCAIEILSRMAQWLGQCNPHGWFHWSVSVFWMSRPPVLEIDSTSFPAGSHEQLCFDFFGPGGPFIPQKLDSFVFWHRFTGRWLDSTEQWRPQA